MRVKLSRNAQRDLVDIGDYIAADDPPAARRFVARLRRIRSAAVHPRAGRVVPELGRDDVRELIEGNYRIAYVVREREIVVLTVFEGHRLLRGAGVNTTETTDE